MSLDRRFIAQAAPVVLAGNVAAVVCGCGQREDWRVAGRFPPPDVLKKHFVRRGWNLGRKAVCGPCQAKKGSTETMTSTLTIQNPPRANGIAPPQQQAAAAVASDAARKAKRLIYQALEDYYDDTKRAYRAAHSDKTIAAELDVAEAVVRQIREESFGPLSEPDEVRAMRAELALAQSEVARLAAAFDKLCSRNGWVV